MKRIEMRLFWYLILTNAVIGTGCELVDKNGSPPASVEKSISEIFGGLELGFTAEQTRQLLGPPTSVALGDWRGFTYHYDSKGLPSSGGELRVWFSEEYSDRAFQIVAVESYPGTTQEGIGLGTTRQVVHNSFGFPQTDSFRLQWRTFGLWARGDLYFGGKYSGLSFEYDSTGCVNRMTAFLTSWENLLEDE